MTILPSVLEPLLRRSIKLSNVSTAAETTKNHALLLVLLDIVAGKAEKHLYDTLQ